MADNRTPQEPDSDESLETLPEDLGLEDEIRQISRKVKTIMKNVEEANAAIRAIIKPETGSEEGETSTDPASEDDADIPSE